MSEYPKILVKKFAPEITVHAPDEEAEKRADGYHSPAGSDPAVGDGPPINTPVDDLPPSDPPTDGPADDGTGEGPTEGPADDDTHVKRGGKKK